MRLPTSFLYREQPQGLRRVVVLMCGEWKPHHDVRTWLLAVIKIRPLVSVKSWFYFAESSLPFLRIRAREIFTSLVDGG